MNVWTQQRCETEEGEDMELSIHIQWGFWWQRKHLYHSIFRNSEAGKSWIMSVFFFLTKGYYQNFKNHKHSFWKRVKTQSSWPKPVSGLEEIAVCGHKIHHNWSGWKVSWGQMRNAGGTWTSSWCPWHLWMSPAIQPALQIWLVFQQSW